MTYTPEFFISDFAKALNEETAAAFIGAGLSQGAGYPGWETLVTDLAQRLNLPSTKDLLTLAQFTVNRDQGRNLVNKKIVEEFTRRRSITDAHRELVKLPLKTFWTTNYDSLIETALQEVRGVPEVKTLQEHLARHIPNRVATVFKMHGDAESPQEAVLIRDDYEEYARTKELFIDVFTADLLMKTFVFLGVSFSDPNLMFLLGRLRSIFGGTRKEHFWIVKSPHPGNTEAEIFKLRIEDLQRYGIRTVALDQHADLAPLLSRVRKAYLALRRRNSVFISGSVKDTNPRAQEIREFAQRLGEHMIVKGRTIITGLGRGIGTWVTTSALEALYKSWDSGIRSDQVIARPFPVGSATDPVVRRAHRLRMISDAQFSIFICGRGETPSGTAEEYDIAREVGSFVLPVGSTGNESSELWNRAYRDLDAIFGTRRSSVEDLFKRLNDPLLPIASHVHTLNEIIDRVQD